MKADLREAARHAPAQASIGTKDAFRARFQRALRSCVRRRFSVAECFGVIWLETLDEVALTDREQSELYDELLNWAKQRLFPEVVPSRSPNIFIDRAAVFRGIPET